MSTTQSQDEAPPPRRKRPSIFANLKSGLSKRAIPGVRAAEDTVKTEADGQGGREGQREVGALGVPLEEHDDGCSCSQPLPRGLASRRESASKRSGRESGEVGVANDWETSNSSDVSAAPAEKTPSLTRDDDLRAITSKAEAQTKSHEDS